MYLCFSSPLTQKSPKTFSHQLLSVNHTPALCLCEHAALLYFYFELHLLQIVLRRQRKGFKCRNKTKKKTITECKWKCILFFHLLGVFQVIFSSFKVFKLSTHSAGWGSVYHQEGSRAALNHVFCMMTVFVFKNTNFVFACFYWRKETTEMNKKCFVFMNINEKMG